MGREHLCFPGAQEKAHLRMGPHQAEIHSAAGPETISAGRDHQSGSKTDCGYPETKTHRERSGSPKEHDTVSKVQRPRALHDADEKWNCTNEATDLGTEGYSHPVTHNSYERILGWK